MSKREKLDRIDSSFDMKDVYPIDPSGEEYEGVQSPNHYNQYPIEVIEMMVRIWGIYNTIQFCYMNAFKYRMRMGSKPGQDLTQELAKETWYLNKADELQQIASSPLIDSRDSKRGRM